MLGKEKVYTRRKGFDVHLYHDHVSQSFEVNGDTLSVYDECFDCYQYVFVRE
jgi:hypothetical protein